AVAAAARQRAGRGAAPAVALLGVGDAVVRPVVALLVAAAIDVSVAAERPVRAAGGAAVVGVVVVVHAVAGGILPRRSRVAAVALLAAGLDAVAAGGTAVRLVGAEPAQRQLEVRLRRVTVAGEDRDLVGVGRGVGARGRRQARLGGREGARP